MRYLLILLSLYANALNAQYNWTLAKAISGLVRNTKIATDKQGNVFVYGDFGGPLTAGSFQLSASSAQCFIAKMDPSGNFVWVKQINGAAMQTGSLAIDAETKCHL